MAVNKEKLQSLLMQVKGTEKAGLKFNIQKMKILDFCPIISWQIDGEAMETVIDLMGSKITVDSWLLPWN